MRTKNKDSERALFFAVICLLVLVPFSYLKIFRGFFQQDEWLAFGFHFLLNSEGAASVLKNAFLLRAGHYNPLSLILEQFLFNIFGLNYFAWAVNSLVMHFLNSVLVFILAKLLFKNFVKAFIASLIFAVTASSFQATAWPVADIGTHQSVFFALISLILFFLFIDKEKRPYLGLSLLSLLISLLFKETAIALFLVFPFAFLLFKKKAKRENRMKTPVLVVLVGIIFISLRLLAFLVPEGMLRGTIYEQAPSVSISPDPGRFIYNLATFPVKGVSQSLIPTQVLLILSEKAANLLPKSVAGQPQTTGYDIFVQKYVLEVINFVIFAIVCFLAVRSKKLGVFLLVFVMVNSLVYALSPERTGRITILDSRNLYFLSIGSAILLVEMIENTFSKYRLKMYLISVLVLVFNLYFLNYSLSKFVSEGTTRRSILERIRREYPSLPARVVFYTESDSSFYGLPQEAKILPFQSGFGQTLIVWYYPGEKFPDEFLKKKYLWEISDQGYLEADGRGFGYFRDLKRLKETVIKNKLGPESIIAYRYNSKMNGLTDITLEVRGKLGKW